MLTLALDTSGAAGSIALARPGQLLAERPLNLGQQHGQSLIPEIRLLLADGKHRPEDIELVAVSVGPGSFTGLRVGVVFAKVFAWTVGCRAAAVGAHEAIASLAPRDPDPRELHVITDAQRGDLFVQVFHPAAGKWAAATDLRIVNAEEWSRSLMAPAIVAGPGVDRVAGLLPPTASVLRDQLPLASAIAQLGLEQAAQGTFADIWTLEPLYLRRSSAEDKWDALHPTGRRFP